MLQHDVMKASSFDDFSSEMIPVNLSSSFYQLVSKFREFSQGVGKRSPIEFRKEEGSRFRSGDEYRFFIVGNCRPIHFYLLITDSRL